VVLAGGLLPGDRSTGRVLSLDLSTGRTRVDHPLAVPVHDTAGATVDHRLLVIGGGNAVEQDIVQARTASGTAWVDAGRLPQPRSDLSVLRVGGRVVVLGGYDGRTAAVGSILTSVDGVDWRRLGRLAVPVRYTAAVANGTSIYTFGGERGGTMTRAVQKVDANGRAAVVARLPVALGHAVAVRFGDRILVVGGRRDATHVTDQMWWFDPSTRRFHSAGRLPGPLADSAVAVRHGTAYLIGGETPTETDGVIVLTLGAS
jgi:N-acetylneuraminic acid mutarotase